MVLGHNLVRFAVPHCTLFITVENRSKRGMAHPTGKLFQETTDVRTTKKRSPSQVQPSVNPGYQVIPNLQKSGALAERRDNSKKVAKIQLKNQSDTYRPTNPLVIIDTASGINLTHDRSLLLDYEEFPKPLSSYYGVGSTDNQKPILIVGQGYLPIRVVGRKVIGLPTLFCPDEDITTISALQLLRLFDVEIVTDYRCLQFKDRKVPTIRRGDILHVQLEGIIAYKQLTSKQKYKIRRIKENYPPDTMFLYEVHLRLSHISAWTIKDSINANVFDGIHQLIFPKEQKKFCCEICRSAKAKQNFYHTNSMNTYTETVQPGTSRSIDLFGPVPDVPVDADRYVLLMVNSLSRYIVVSTQKMKSEGTIVPQFRKKCWVY